MNRREWLVELARSVAPDQAVSVPAGWLLEALGTDTMAHSTDRVTVDLTVAEVAARFGRKSTSTVRVWCEKGLFPHAYRLHGREWRVPPADIQALQEQQSQNAQRLRIPVQHEPVETGSISDWRKFRRKKAPDQAA